MDSKLKFVELIAKSGVFFGAVDGNYDDKEAAFVNLFVTFLKAQLGLNADAEDIVRKVTKQTYTLDQIIDGTKEAVAGLSESEKKDTLKSMSNFINTIICMDGVECVTERDSYNEWKKAVGVE